MASVDPRPPIRGAPGPIRGAAAVEGFLPAARTPLVRRSALVILSAGGVLALAWLLTTPGHGFDFYAYWAMDTANPYAIPNGFGAFSYPPPFVWLAAPLGAAPFEAGYWAWTGLGLLALAWLTRRWMLAWLLFPPVISELYHGNVHLLMAVGIVLGFRVAAAWAPVALVKVASGVIVVWPIVRRDRRSLRLLLAGVILLVVPTVLISPHLWEEWVQHLLARGGVPTLWGAEIGIPLGVRLLPAVALMAWGARTNRRWAMAPAVVLAMPQLWVHSLAVLTALPRLLEEPVKPEPGA